MTLGFHDGRRSGDGLSQAAPLGRGSGFGMKILQVVTLFTPDGAFGGPMRVALNQTDELRSRGHDVTLVGAARGYPDSTPVEVAGTSVTLTKAYRAIPHLRFAGLFSPALLLSVLRKGHTYDAIHIHLARDLVTMPVSHYSRVRRFPFHVQTHGMIDPPANAFTRAVDRIETRKSINAATTVFALSDQEIARLRQVSGSSAGVFVKLPNGIGVSDAVVPPPKAPNVLFLARMHERKRPVAFTESAVILANDYPAVKFSLVGPDEGEAKKVELLIAAAGAQRQVAWEGPLSPDLTQARMQSSSIYVLPAANEPFGMTIIEAMAAARPVVVTRSCQLAPFVEESGGGLVVDHTEKSLTGAIRTLLDNPDRAAAMGRLARAAAVRTYGIGPVVDVLEDRYATTNRKGT